jgi:ABC-type transport system involved in cytochrome c biogenesis permease subunit
MRTLGETRLWYSFLLPIFGLLMALKLKKTWIMIYTSSMAILFLLLNYFNPDNFDKTLMPALQSPWFIPHVIVYMVAYALLGATSIYSFKRIISYKFEKFNNSLMNMNEIDNFVYTGFSFLTLGLIFGALWAKEAWGDYWAWDPKETWALITWLFYLSYLHLNRKNAKDSKLSAFFLAFGFIILLICWFGINYMPTAKNSVHTYTFEN